MDYTISEVSEVFTSIADILTTQCKLNYNAMLSLHSMGYNGFKRWHRVNTKKFLCMKLELANNFFDMFRKKLVSNDVKVEYSPASMEEHLKSWNASLKTSIDELATLQRKYFNMIGAECCVIKKAMECIGKDYEKVNRYYERFVSSDWLSLDMHIVDDDIHTKMKALEDEHGGKY